MRRSASYSTTPPIPGGIYAPLILGQLQSLREAYHGPDFTPAVSLECEYILGNLTPEVYIALSTVAEGLK